MSYFVEIPKMSFVFLRCSLNRPTSEVRFRPAGQRFQQAERRAERSSYFAEARKRRRIAKAFELLKRYRVTRYTPCHVRANILSFRVNRKCKDTLLLGDAKYVLAFLFINRTEF